MGKLLVVTSGKGGVGKSSISAGLAGALVRRNRTVLLVDMDEGLRCLDLMLGVAASTVFDLGDVLDGHCTADQAALTVEGFSGRLKLIAAPLKPDTIKAEATEKLSRELILEYDYLIFDCPAGTSAGFINSLPGGSMAIVVANADPVSQRDAAVVDALLERQGISSRQMVINKFNLKRMKRSGFPHIDAMIDESGLQLLAIIPEDEQVPLSSADGKPLRKGRARAAIDRLAARVEGEHVLLPPLKKI